MTRLEWSDASASSYCAESAVINGRTITVCLDDEGPLRPAFYWTLDDANGARVTDGWASSVRQARRDAFDAAQS